QIRTGSIEADISAVARGVADAGTVVAALSVIGPANRFDEDAERVAAQALDVAVRRLGDELGFVRAPTDGRDAAGLGGGR
ncbi:MAG: hypothetical protein QNJ12_18275, partial [Ilumatobacter sp.]